MKDKHKTKQQLIDELYVSDLYTSAGGVDAFVKDLNHVLYHPHGVEINIPYNVSDADLALTLELELNSLPEFTVANIGTNQIQVHQNIPGDIFWMHDGYKHISVEGRSPEYDTGLAFSHDTLAYDDLPNTAVDQTITTTGVDIANISSKYFEVYSPFREYYIWFNVSDENYQTTGVDPDVVDTATIGFNPSVINVPEATLNTPVPICLGKCFNVEPKLIDANNHVYQVHEGRVADILNVRSNGVPMGLPGTADEQYEINVDIG